MWRHLGAGGVIWRHLGWHILNLIGISNNILSDLNVMEKPDASDHGLKAEALRVDILDSV